MTFSNFVMSLQLDCCVCQSGFPTKAAVTKVNMSSKLIWKQLDWTFTAFPKATEGGGCALPTFFLVHLEEWLQPRPKSATTEEISTLEDKEVLWDLVQFTRSSGKSGAFVKSINFKSVSW